MKTDARIRYTQKVIRDTLLNLLEQKPINKITVTEICTLSEINRATFYYHYRDAFQLLDQIQQEMFQELEENLKHKKEEQNFNLGAAILTVVNSNADLFKVLFSVNGDKLFLRELANFGKELSLKDWQKQHPHASMEELKSIYAYISNGSVAIIEHWLKDGMRSPPEKVGDFLNKLTAQALSILK